jgi:HK97 family phage portal protein
MGIFTKAASIIARGLGLSDPRLYQWFTGGSSNAGETVTVNTAMQLDVVFACVTLIAKTVSTLPFQLFATDGNGNGVIARNASLYGILHDKPNTEMTAVTFWQAMIGCLLLWGNAYAQIIRTDIGRVVALIPLVPDRLRATRQSDGSILYRYSYLGQVTELNEDEVFHVKGFSLDGLVGLSPISLARETLGIAMAAEKSAASFFRNGMRPSLAVTSPTYLNEAQRKIYEEDFKPKLVGSINTGGIPLLQGGWDIKELSINPDDAQLLATRGFSVEQICRWFGVVPAMIGHMEKSTAWGTGLEQMNLWFLIYTLRPILESIEQEVSRSLLTPVERLSFYAEFNVEGLLRADSRGRAEIMQIHANSGLRTRDELRALDNMPPLPGGDVLTVLSTLTTLERVKNPPVPPPVVAPQPQPAGA